MTKLLTATDITKSYSGVQALRGASFDLVSGEVHALVGENGAGKSTLVKIITGAVDADGGEIKLNGEPITHNSPRLARSRGVAAIYQQPALFPDLTVTENIALGFDRTSPWSRIDWKRRRRRAAELLSRVGAGFDSEALAGSLSMPRQQLVEIARALGADANILIMDEPTASLSQEETQALFEVIRGLRARGAGVVYISHRLEELTAIADRVTVLRDGRSVATRGVSEINERDLISLMVGRELSTVFPKKEVEFGEVVLELRDLGCSGAAVRSVNLSVRAGEIVGLTGLVGAGRTELATTVFGLTPPDSGEILLRGKPVRITSPIDAIAQGLAYLPEDRRRHGVILDMPLSANITLASLDRLSRSGVLDSRKEREIASEYTARLGIKTPAIFAPVSTLSGGNQQKAALSRWLATKPSVLILDEPTQGVDVGAKSEIHALMSELAGRGAAVLMISSDLPEILGMSDRIAVMRGGTIVATVQRRDASQEEILSLAIGRGAREPQSELGDIGA